MRGHIDALTRALHVNPREQNEPRTPRALQPRGARTTFQPVRDESLRRGLAH